MVAFYFAHDYMFSKLIGVLLLLVVLFAFVIGLNEIINNYFDKKNKQAEHETKKNK